MSNFCVVCHEPLDDSNVCASGHLGSEPQTGINLQRGILEELHDMKTKLDTIDATIVLLDARITALEPP